MESPIKKPSQGAEVSAVRRGAPWWIWVLAASFVLNFALVIYLDLAGPSLAMYAAFTRGHVVVSGFYFQSPAAAGGLRAGDHILRANGRAITSYLEWFSVLLNLKVGEPVTFEVQRNNEYINLSVVPEQRSFSRSFSALTLPSPFNPLLHALLRFGQLVTLGLACLVAFARPRNGAALIAALFFAGLSGFNAADALSGIYPLLRSLPPVLFALLYI